MSKGRSALPYTCSIEFSMYVFISSLSTRTATHSLLLQTSSSLASILHLFLDATSLLGMTKPRILNLCTHSEHDKNEEAPRRGNAIQQPPSFVVLVPGFAVVSWYRASRSSHSEHNHCSCLSHAHATSTNSEHCIHFHIVFVLFILCVLFRVVICCFYI